MTLYRADPHLLDRYRHRAPGEPAPIRPNEPVASPPAADAAVPPRLVRPYVAAPPHER